MFKCILPLLPVLGVCVLFPPLLGKTATKQYIKVEKWRVLHEELSRNRAMHVK